MLLLERFGMVVAAAAFAVASRRSRQELAFVQLLLATGLVMRMGRSGIGIVAGDETPTGRKIVHF